VKREIGGRTDATRDAAARWVAVEILESEADHGRDAYGSKKHGCRSIDLDHHCVQRGPRRRSVGTRLNRGFVYIRYVVLRASVERAVFESYPAILRWTSGAIVYMRSKEQFLAKG